MKLKVFTYKPNNSNYSIDYEIEITNAPEDTDWNRWAMLQDGKDYRLYCFKQNSNNTLYQFAFNGASYEFAYNSIPEVTITNVPATANTNAIAMLHDGEKYRLYFADESNETVLHQFEWNGNEYEYLPMQTKTVFGISPEADTSTIAMLHTGKHYTYYALNTQRDTLHQAIYNVDSNTYEVSNTIAVAKEGITTTNGFSMAFGENTYWLYFLEA